MTIRSLSDRWQPSCVNVVPSPSFGAYRPCRRYFLCFQVLCSFLFRLVFPYLLLFFLDLFLLPAGFLWCVSPRVRLPRGYRPRVASLGESISVQKNRINHVSDDISMRALCDTSPSPFQLGSLDVCALADTGILIIHKYPWDRGFQICQLCTRRHEKLIFYLLFESDRFHVLFFIR